MDFRVRILLLFVVHSLPSEGLNSVEEIPPPLQEQLRTAPSSTSSLRSDATVSSLATSTKAIVNRSVVNESVQRITQTKRAPSSIRSVGAVRHLALKKASRRNVSRITTTTLPTSRQLIKDPDASVDNGANVSPPADNVAVGEGVAKEDTEPVKDKDKEENQLGAMVEDAKGNVAVPLTSSKFQPRINFNQSEDSYFMTFVVVGGMFLFCVYLVYHNKKKILGLIFEGRASSHSRRNVRYRRLSQREEVDKESVTH